MSSQLPKLPHRHRVAILVESSRAYGRGVLRGIATYVQTHRHWSVYLQSRAPEDPPPPWLDGWKGDGIIARVDSWELAEAIRKTGIPAIDMRGSLDLDMPLVETDDHSACRIAIDHFLERGFRHLAFCGFESANYSERRLRYFGELAQAKGLVLHSYQSPLPAHLKMETRLSAREQWAILFERDMADWLRELPKPVGLLACNDVCGQQVLNACREIGIPVPDAVAVLGVDNDRLICNLSDPPLSSIVLNATRIGSTAAFLLDQMITGGENPPRKTFVEAIGVAVRQSTDILAVNDPLVAKAVRYIRENACAGISVAEVLHHVPLSRRKLERRFRDILGCSPNEEITRVRLGRAKDLLATTDLSLAIIAEMIGYAHTEYFSTVFRKKVGVSPSEFRGRIQTD